MNNNKFNLSDKKTIFFSGIGGISMSGMAKLLLHNGFKLYGSDTARSDLTVELENCGAKIYYRQSKYNISDDIDLVVHSAAIHRDNEELVEAFNRNIPIMTRAEFLGELMNNYDNVIGVSGTHGKTTVTSMISDIFLEAKLDPTISVGGIMPSIGSNFHIGKKEVFITEACEYTNSFLNFNPDTAVILNCELDHTDFFKDENDFRNSFRLYTLNVPKGGNVVINAAIKDVEYFNNKDINFITYSKDVDADYTAKNIKIIDNKCTEFDVYKGESIVDKFILPTIGIYNVDNALAAIIVAIINNIDIETIKNALSNFKCTQRRFEIMGKIGEVTVINEFAHHPTAIRYAIETARKLDHNKLWLVFQPHAYSRTKDFLDDFVEVLSLADSVILTPIYAAREINTYNVYSSDIVEKLKLKNIQTYNASSFSEAEDIVLTRTESNDIVMAIGGGDIDKVAKDLMGISYAHN